ncbi:MULTISPECIES: lysozyme inhibitor LprI family protein [Pseudomonas]|uniref:lysozyme inhibitor LprI family protein n=1 Tax=Pseudomonas TaxID=286 RepID=UPI0009B8E28D|nr:MULTISPECIES: lysozyme inhibitor LprI family protein [Pseudomonas]QUN68447.1 DUF1311 domain-containing protein [Pseudomonas sp. JS425]
MNRHLAVLSLSLVFSLHASAQENYSAEYAMCVDKSEGITSNLSDCSNEELTKQNERLNKYYKVAMANLAADKKTQLRDVQRVWIKYRDSNCGMYYTLSGGSMDVLNGVGCELSMTQERADELQWFAENGGE